MNYNYDNVRHIELLKYSETLKMNNQSLERKDRNSYLVFGATILRNKTSRRNLLERKK